MAKPLREIVPLNELSKKTLSNYLPNATWNASIWASKYGNPSEKAVSKSPQLQHYQRKIKNRSGGVLRATSRLVTGRTDDIVKSVTDKIKKGERTIRSGKVSGGHHKDKLGNYVLTSTGDAIRTGQSAQELARRSRNQSDAGALGAYIGHRIWKRTKGVERAAKRLAEENPK